jgi:hypothetical protein
VLLRWIVQAQRRVQQVRTDSMNAKQGLRQDAKLRRAALISQQMEAELTTAKARRVKAAERRMASERAMKADTAGVAGYHEIDYKLGDAFKGEWSAQGVSAAWGK